MSWRCGSLDHCQLFWMRAALPDFLTRQRRSRSPRLNTFEMFTVDLPLSIPVHGQDQHPKPEPLPKCAARDLTACGLTTCASRHAPCARASVRSTPSAKPTSSVRPSGAQRQQRAARLNARHRSCFCAPSVYEYKRTWRMKSGKRRRYVESRDDPLLTIRAQAETGVSFSRVCS